jgi:hypothetical protein
MGINTEILQYHLDRSGPRQCNMITFQVMAFSEMSPHDDYAIRTFDQSINNQVRMYHARAHHTDCPHVGGILQAGYTCKISSGIRTPVAKKSDYFGFKII